jgi:hypothetical protein
MGRRSAAAAVTVPRIALPRRLSFRRQESMSPAAIDHRGAQFFKM